MRKLSDLIILVRGGGEVGSAIAHRLNRSHFRVCITELAIPEAIHRGASFSEAIFDSARTVESVTAERTLISLEKIYSAWRNGHIPIVADPELSVKPLIKPDVLVNAMMLKRETNTRMTDAPLVIGIGPGFIAGGDVHLVIESNPGNNLGRVILEGEPEKDSARPDELNGSGKDRVVSAEETGVFTTERNIGDAVLAGDIIGNINDLPLKAPISGVLCGLLRNEAKVLPNAKLAEIDSEHDKSVCFAIRGRTRAIAGGVLEAILMSFNLAEMD
jgi:xanthine dehydrogenase accessory factor